LAKFSREKWLVLKLVSAERSDLSSLIWKRCSSLKLDRLEKMSNLDNRGHSNQKLDRKFGDLKVCNFGRISCNLIAISLNWSKTSFAVLRQWYFY